MKNNTVHQSFVCRIVPSRLDRASITLPIFAFIAVFAGWLLAGTVAHAQTPVLRFSFEDTGNTTDTNSQSAAVILTNFTKSATYTTADLHGPAGSGVSGQLDNNRSLVLTNGVYNASVATNGPGAWVANSSTLASAPGGTITAFTVTEWFKSAVLPPANSLLGRGFVLGAGNPADINAVNTIGMKWQQPNQWYVSIANGNPTASAIFPANLPINTWLFMAIVYDGTNVMIYQGTDTTPAKLISTTLAPGLTTALGSSASLYIGNRNGRQRAYVGWIDEFRFYTNASSASAVEGIRQESSGGGPIVPSFYPDGLRLQQYTNKFVFTAISPSTVWGPSTNITSIQMTLNGVDVSSSLVLVTNGTAGTSTNVSASYTGLQKNQTNSVLITVTDANGKIGTVSVNFDTFSPTNFVWEAEEFDYNNGLYIDNADYTSSASGTSYFGLDSVNTVDTVKGTGTGVNASDYRAGATDTTKTQTPASTDIPRQRFLDLAAIDPAVVDHVIGNWSSAEWQNYTRTFPAGNYNIYARASSGSSSTLTLDHVTAGQGTSSQTKTNLGTCAYTGNNQLAYTWVPLKNSLGNLAVVNLAGVNTLKVTSGGSANANFYMLVPANTNVPSITGIYPSMLLQPTNKLVFTASSTVTTINTNSITLILNGTNNVATNLVFSGGPSTWNVSYTGLLPNTTYTAAISVTDANGNTANSSFTFDTWNPVLVVEAEDFDFNSGQYIDNPVPTTSEAGNSYFWRVGTMNIDESNNNGAPPYAGANPANYRANPSGADPIACTPITDFPRKQFIDAAAPDYNIGFMGVFFWQNYTRTWPTGTFNVYIRVASGAATPATQHEGFDQITGGWGTVNQFLKPIGVFNIPRTGGWSAYMYVPLTDQFGNYANVTMGGTNTFRATFGRALGTSYTGDSTVGAANINFYMLLAARTDLPRIDGVYPNNLVSMQSTNKLAFVASSPNGINTTNIHVTLNGVDVSTNLVFTGSSTSWNVSYTGLLPGTAYTAVITIKDANNQTITTTVNFSTAFNPADYTWEAEDYDFDPSQSPVPNGSGNRFIDNPAFTTVAATNSYYGQVGAIDVDESIIWGLNTALPPAADYQYRQFDYVPCEVTSDQLRQDYLDAQIQSTNPFIADYDVCFWATNAWLNYTRTFPAGQFYLYARLSAGNGALNLQCAQVTGGWGTTTQTNQYLGTFTGTGTSFATWQWVPLVNTNTSQPVVLSLGGTNTFQMTGDYNENVNFFQLVPLAQSVSLTASLSGTNIALSFPTQVGSTYTVYYKNNLTDPTWTQLGAPVSGDGSIMSVLDGISESHRFYRLTIQ